MDTKECKNCQVTKPITDFYQHGPYLCSSCKICYNLKHKKRDGKVNGIDEFEGNPNDLEGAKNTLIAMGYDLERNIHEQFMERMSLRQSKI